MRGKIAFCSSILGLVAFLISSPVFSSDEAYYEVKITNLTFNQTFTPILVASHRYGVELFNLGEPASNQLSQLAEGGDVGPLISLLEHDPRVADVNDSGVFLGPGESVVVKVAAHYGARKISLASMLIPTNDAFIALNGVNAPWSYRTVSYRSPAYDAGSEPNDERCANIPGPVCEGQGISADASGENFVHIHPGIHGIGNLAPDRYDWRNPVADIKIRRIHATRHND